MNILCKYTYPEICLLFKIQVSKHNVFGISCVIFRVTRAITLIFERILFRNSQNIRTRMFLTFFVHTLMYIFMHVFIYSSLIDLTFKKWRKLKKKFPKITITPTILNRFISNQSDELLGWYSTFCVLYCL